MSPTTGPLVMVLCIVGAVALVVWGIASLVETPTIDVQRAAALGAAEAAWGER